MCLVSSRLCSLERTFSMGGPLLLTTKLLMFSFSLGSSSTARVPSITRSIMKTFLSIRRTSSLISTMARDDDDVAFTDSSRAPRKRLPHSSSTTAILSSTVVWVVFSSTGRGPSVCNATSIPQSQEVDLTAPL